MSQAAGSPEEDNLHPPSQPLELVEFQISLLRTLFGGDEWFLTEQQRKQHHPAFQRWKLCHLLKEQQGCFRFPEDRKLVPAFATLLLDNMAISQSSGGRLTSFSLGNFANYGYEKVRQRISKAIYEPTSFLSVMTEFGYAAWHLQEGHQITAFEDEGDVDFQITVPQLPLPILADTKRIGPDTGRNRYKKLVEKINNQIKSKKAKLGKDVYGLGVIDITNHVTQKAMCTSDATPKNVEGITDTVQNLLKNHYSSVSAVVLQWDWHELLGSPLLYTTFRPDDRRNAMAFLLRNSCIIRHKNPVSSLPEEDQPFLPGNTLAFGIKGDPLF